MADERVAPGGCAQTGIHLPAFIVVTDSKLSQHIISAAFTVCSIHRAQHPPCGQHRSTGYSCYFRPTCATLAIRRRPRPTTPHRLFQVIPGYSELVYTSYSKLYATRRYSRLVDGARDQIQRSFQTLYGQRQAFFYLWAFSAPLVGANEGQPKTSFAPTRGAQNIMILLKPLDLQTFSLSLHSLIRNPNPSFPSPGLRFSFARSPSYRSRHGGAARAHHPSHLIAGAQA